MPLFRPPNIEKLQTKGNIKGLIKAFSQRDPKGFQDIKVSGLAEDALVQIGEPAVDPLIVALNSKNSHVRGSAAKALGLIGDKRAIYPLITSLGDEIMSVRYLATNALVEIGEPAVEMLIDAFEQMGKDIRIEIADVLGEIGDTRAVTTLIDAFEEDTRSIGSSCAKALGRIGDERAVESLLSVIKDENKWFVHNQVIEALGKIRDERAVEPLISVLRSGKSSHAADALVEIGKPSVKQLVAILRDQNWEVRNESARALETIGWRPRRSVNGAAFWIAKQEWDKCAKIGEPAVEFLISDLENQLESDSVARVLGEIGDVRAVEPLIDALKDQTMRGTASTALVKIGAPAVEPLIADLTDDRRYLRETVARILGEIGDNRAIEPLLTALEDKSISKTAAKSLEILGWEPDPLTTGPAFWITRGKWEKLVEVGEPAIDSLINTLKDEELREAAAKTLMQMGEQAIDQLILALEDKQIRKYVAGVLGMMGNARAEKPLLAALDDKEWSMCKAAAEALDNLNWQPTSDRDGAAYWIAKCNWDKCVEIGTPAVKPLIATITKGPWPLRKSVAISLGIIGDSHAVEPLIHALQHQGDKMREAAAEALGQIGDKKAVEPLIHALENDEDRAVCEEAARALGQIGDQRAVQSLMESAIYSKYDAYYVARAAVYSLGQIGDARAVEPLISLLDTRDHASWGAKGALVMIGEPAIGPLVETLKDKNAPWIAHRHAREALEELNWHPDHNEDGAAYWIVADDFDKCVEIGIPAVEPLINALRFVDWGTRRRAANALVALYNSGILDERSKQVILAERATITHPHKDVPASSDCSHTDFGVGVDFPM